MTPTEVHRQFYLGAAGIRLWYAREPLPGAAPSLEFEIPEPDMPVWPQLTAPGSSLSKGSGTANRVPGSVPLPSAGPDQRGGQRIAGLQALMEQKEGADGKEPSAQKSPVKAGLPSGDEQGAAGPMPVPQVPLAQMPNLNIRVFSGEGHVLIADISKDASLGLQEALAENILKSLGDVQLGSAKWVQWPVFNNRLVAGRGHADLVSIIKNILSDSTSKKLIVLGSGVMGGSDGWLAEALERAPDIESEYSLAELASNSGFKRSLWQKLKSVVRV
ncbi:hypothetical protein [Marinobacter sp. ANT_B65]|uniref:hypothetical protein n=1 Tax=Marinobacter sp. ANT_B65 TaxID=2039467 RepID=UPI000BBE665A|nr:hypothetical protein [Marinobacter sp. ANT_B65]PCM43860.1 hypothetical protein CPA50_16050 [Marinobacter sp. ANT_B65]